MEYIIDADMQYSIVRIIYKLSVESKPTPVPSKVIIKRSFCPQFPPECIFCDKIEISHCRKKRDQLCSPLSETKLTAANKLSTRLENGTSTISSTSQRQRTCSPLKHNIIRHILRLFVRHFPTMNVGQHMTQKRRIG